MNLPPPMQSKAFNEIQENLSEAYKQVADVSMQNAANEFRFSGAEREIDLDVSCDGRVPDITVSGDKSWQKRGHSSFNGVVTIIASDSAKCQDYRVLSETYNASKSWEVRKEAEPNLYQKFGDTHDCYINH